jgi:monovalent cation/hydrogen antiporter
MTCSHLASTPLDAVPTASRADGCPDCLADDFHGWVHLRQCLNCGHVGCCDSSPRRHATKHNADTGHPVIRSIEPGEAWRWCYADDLVG